MPQPSTSDIGKLVWAIPEGWIPIWSHDLEPEMLSHEAACILNPNDRDAQIEITIYFTNREPIGSYKLTVGAHAAPALQRSE